jgi:tetratricopeptide (TPR) repeat protein
LVVVEDAHWLDAASAGLLAALLPRVPRSGWTVLITRRNVTGGLQLPDTVPVTRMALRLLDREGLVELAARTADGAVLPPGTIDELVERSDGNPLFLRELVTAAVSGSLDEVPESIEAVVAASIDTLAAPDRALLRHAAVLGGRAPLAILAAMLDRPLGDVERAVRRLGHFLLPAGDGILRFSHILLRDVAYEGLSFRTRRALHERAGHILERSTPDPTTLAELLSIHFDRAGRHRESWHYSCVAGERSQRSGAPIEAAAFYERALDAADRLDEIAVAERADVAERLGDACELSGRYHQASTAYRRARRLGRGEPTRLVRLCRKLGYVRDHEGRYDAAQRWFRRGLAETSEVPDADEALTLRAELATAIVSSKYRQGRHARAMPLIRRAISDASQTGAKAALAHAYFVYDELLIDGGRYQEASYSRLAADIYEELGDHRGAAAAFNMSGISAYWLGEWDEAVHWYERAIEEDRKAGAIVYNAIYLNNIAEIRSDQGRLHEAEHLLHEAHDLWTSGGWRAGTGWALSNLGRLFARAGRFDEADKRLEEAREVLTEIGADGMLLETEARTMERGVLAGDHAAALDLVEDLLARAKRLSFVSVEAMVERLQGYALCQAGDCGRAFGLIEQSVAGCRARGARYEVALGLEALTQVGRSVGRTPAELAPDATECAEIFTQLGVVGTPTVPLPIPA